MSEWKRELLQGIENMGIKAHSRIFTLCVCYVANQRSHKLYSEVCCGDYVVNVMQSAIYARRVC